jgi:hypothetical protein
MALSSRERVLKILKHEEADVVTKDMGSMNNSTWKTP